MPRARWVLVGLAGSAVGARHHDFVELAARPGEHTLAATARNAVGLSAWYAADAAAAPASAGGGVQRAAAVLAGPAFEAALAAGSITAHSVRPDELKRHRLSFMLAYGASFGEVPHAKLQSELERANLTSLLRSAAVPALSFARLCEAEGVGSIGLLSLHLSGLELSQQHAAVLRSVTEACEAGRWPAAIISDPKWSDAHHRRFVAFLRRSNYTAAAGLFVRSSRGASPAGRPAGRPAAAPAHLDFVEIGTSDFETLSHEAQEHATGLAVEALPFYLARLPVRRGVTKVNAAVVGSADAGRPIRMFYIDPEDIRRNGLPAWLKGCNQVHAPHGEGLRELRRRGMGKLMRNVSVPARTFGSIMSEHGVRSIGLLKLDVEGQEANIVDAVVEACDAAPPICPRALVWEVTHQPREVQLRLHEALVARGYIWASPKPRRDRLYVRGSAGAEQRANARGRARRGVAELHAMEDR